VPIELFGDSRFPTVGTQPYALSLAPYGFYWFKLQRQARHDGSYGIEGSVI